jgi:WD40 repeat protein
MSAEGNLPSARAGQTFGKAIGLAIGAFVVAAIGFSAGWLIGGRRTVVSSTSPSRDAVAYIFEARCAGGSCQSLMIGPTSRDARTIETLKGDSEKADEIAWTPDGGRVAFLVNGYQLRVFDARTGASLGAVSLIEPDRSPSTRIARGVTFSTNGAAVTFDDCPRAHSGCRPGLVALR